MTTDAAVADVFRAEVGALTASLVRVLGDFEVAEEIVQDALLVALERWPSEGIPERPGAWLMTVARRLALNRLARDRRYREKLRLLAATPADEPDDRLRLIFTCCHPALSREAQVALTLRTVCGLTTAAIARALVSSEAAIAQRIVRARRKIVAAGIPYRIPRDADLDSRLREVLDVLYLMYNEGYLATAGDAPQRRDLAAEATWLVQLVCRLLPAAPEPLGLAALMSLHTARSRARFDAADHLVLLRDQDRSGWDGELIARGVAMIEQAASLKKVGPYQLEAAIAACHMEAPSIEATDWAQIVALYDLLLTVAPSPVVRLNRALALRELVGDAAALLAIEPLADDLGGYHLFHAARGELLGDLGRRDEARDATERALALTRNPAERALLRGRLRRVEEP